MPQPMPPQGAPGPQPPPSNGPGPGPSPDPQGSGGGGGISNLLTSIDKAIDHLMQVVGQDKSVPPEAKQALQMADQGFGKFMDIVTGQQSAPDEDDGGGQGQTTPPEAGGNKGAIPSPV